MSFMISEKAKKHQLEYIRKWRKEHPEKVSMYASKSLENIKRDPERYEKFKKHRREYMSIPENRLKANERKRRWREKNREKIREQNKIRNNRWYQKIKNEGAERYKKLLAQKLEWAKKNPEKNREKALRWLHKHKHEYKYIDGKRIRIKELIAK